MEKPKSTASEGRYAHGRSTSLPGLAAHRRRQGLTQRQPGELDGGVNHTGQRLESLARGAYPRIVDLLSCSGESAIWGNHCASCVPVDRRMGVLEFGIG